MKISESNWLRFSVDFENGKFPNQRFGQAFCNTLLNNSEEEEKIRVEEGVDLFNETDNLLVKSFIVNNFIKKLS